jgi:hypothetical protein
MEGIETNPWPISEWRHRAPGQNSCWSDSQPRWAHHARIHNQTWNHINFSSSIVANYISSLWLSELPFMANVNILSLFHPSIQQNGHVIGLWIGQWQFLWDHSGNGQILTPSIRRSWCFPVWSLRLSQEIALKIQSEYLWQFQTPTSTAYRTVAWNDCITQKLLKTCKMYSTTKKGDTQPFHSIQKWTAQLENDTIIWHTPITYYWTVPLILDHWYLVG